MPNLPLVLIAVSVPAASVPPMVMPRKASPVVGPIAEVTLSPFVREPFTCVEHPLGQLEYTGDALGTDCTVIGGVAKSGGFAREYRTDGRRNEDWYGWHATLLAPCDCEIVGAFAKSEANTPGTFGRPPAAMIQFRRSDGVIIVYAHVADIVVRLGDHVVAGQPVAKVGNNGFARAPHTHIGAWREADGTPLQIRWDLRAMARLQAEVGS